MSDKEMLAQKVHPSCAKCGRPHAAHYPINRDGACYGYVPRAALGAKVIPAYCKCSFTDSDGSVVPGERCLIHPET